MIVRSRRSAKRHQRGVRSPIAEDDEYLSTGTSPTLVRLPHERVAVRTGVVAQAAEGGRRVTAVTARDEARPPGGAGEDIETTVAVERELDRHRVACARVGARRLGDEWRVKACEGVAD